MSVKSDLRDVKSSEFFWDNMAMLGFENKSRALVMAIKEAVDNALDSAEEIGVKPKISVSLEDISEDLVMMEVEDNAGGLPKDEVENAFGQILHSSRFGKWKQTRGQQGIGISAVFLWSQKFQSRPTEIITKEYGDDEAWRIVISSKKKGKQIVVEEKEKVNWDKEHGTKIRVPVPANWRSRRHLREYIEGTHLANPSAQIEYTERGDYQIFERTHDKPQKPPEEMKPHPNAADTGLIQELIESTSAGSMKPFLEQEFSQVDRKTSRKILRHAGIESDNPFILRGDDLERLVKAMRSVKTRSPSDKALSPVGEDLIRETLESYNPEFIGTSTRDLITIDGHPTIIETGVAYGGDIQSKGTVDYYRVANRVPLVYDSNACSLRKAIDSVDWERYNLEQTTSGIPSGPAVIFVHICSTQVLFGNEAKTYVAENNNLIEETKLSLQQCGREFSQFVDEKERRAKHKKKVKNMIPIYQALGQKLGEVTEENEQEIFQSIGKSCSTVIVDDREDTNNIVINPTNKNKDIKIDGKETQISPGETINYENEIESYLYPVFISEIK